MTNSEAKKAYDDYMKSLYSAENIAKAGGIENHAKIIRDFKKKERKLRVKTIIRWFCHGELKIIIAFPILAIIAKMLFFPGITYFHILKATAIVGIIMIIHCLCYAIHYYCFYLKS